ncbi:hypothetical protein CIPAW_14G131900 [Carya illinoinensis]|uniref:TIR domain-containing protein n=2 Tax=Carya illinoinensis TaxID=32201 RepID=A0A8T1NMU4_CARIL|nr:hypothetical protein CIPAW_14G131900 [Carya illinoinensis]
MVTQRPSSSTNSEDTEKRERDNSSCSEEDEKIISSSSPSSSTPRLTHDVFLSFYGEIISSSSPSSSTPRSKHDVFLSFYGEDTRRSFTDHLYFDLKRKGILVFRDDESLERGKCISQELPQAIQESQYAIVIFSANYASSKWCLRELAEIVEWEEKKNLTIIPIFYHVNPSDVRNQRGTFAEAFAAHEKDLKVDIKEIDTWRNACRKVGNVSGEHINGERYESVIREEISRSISTKLNSRFSHHDYKKLVAINSRVEDMMHLLAMESNDVRFLGIHGMGGVGKTTLAEIIYDRVSYQFEGSSFISHIRERSTTARDLASLQKELLHGIMQEEIPFWDDHQGIGMIMNKLQNKRVIIVLDDVDSEKQLTALAGNQKWFGPGSRVIITCRDSHLLRTHGVYGMYEVQLLQTDEALQLFSLSAFRKNNPPENYMDLSKHFVKYAQGLPLALKVLGSYLFGRTIDAWESARDQLEPIPNKHIMNILQISFEGLEESQQKLFLDVACFSQLDGWLKNDSEEALEIFGHYSNIEIEILINNSLVSKSKYESLVMHDLLKKMGQEIVRRECPIEPGKRSRLSHYRDVLGVLEKDTGTDAIEGIVLQDLPHMKKIRSLNAKAFSKMTKLRLLKISVPPIFSQIYPSPIIEWLGNPLKHMPSDKLRYFHWFNCPSKSWPSSFQPKNLIVLSMPGSRFKRIWKGLVVLHNLKLLDLSDSEDLIETPNLTGASNLEKIDLARCRSLCEVHPSIGVLKRLKHLSLNRCKCLRRLPAKFCLESLEILDLSGCTGLVNILDIQGDMTSLRIVYFSEPTKKDLPSSFMSFSGLRNLTLSGCKNISIFPSVICSLSSLESLHLYGWSRLQKFPDLSSLECLMHLKADGTALTQIPSVNLIPKSIRSFFLEGRKRMPCKPLPKRSSYLTYDIGTPVEYEMEGMLEVEALLINFGGTGKYSSNIIFADKVMIYAWSLGYGIPEWVHNRSNGSSLKIELDGTMKGVDCAIFIVCDYHQFHSPEGTSISSLFKERSYVKFKFCFETDDGSLGDCFYELRFPYSVDVVCFIKPIVFWAHTQTPKFFKRWKSNNLDKRSSIKISLTAEILDYVSNQTPVELEVKEWGMHLVCPDDAGLGLGLDLDSYLQFYSVWKCGMERNED